MSCFICVGGGKLRGVWSLASDDVATYVRVFDVHSLLLAKAVFERSDLRCCLDWNFTLVAAKGDQQCNSKEAAPACPFGILLDAFPLLRAHSLRRHPPFPSA